MRCIRLVPALFVLAMVWNFGLRAEEIDVPMPQLLRKTKEDRSLADKLQAGNYPAALKEASKLVKKKHPTAGAYLLVASQQASEGESQAAIQTLEKGLRHQGTDLPLLVMLAKLHEDRARLGPGGERVGGAIRYTKLPGDLDAVTFRLVELRAAVACLSEAARYQPTVPLYHAKRIWLLLAAGDVAAADEVAAAAVKQFPDHSIVQLEAAKVAARAGRWQEARQHAERSLALRSNEAAAYQVLADAAEQAGDVAAKNEYIRQATFYAFVPEFLPLKFSARTADAADRLTRHPDLQEEPSQAAAQAWRSQARAFIERLMDEKDADSTWLLAAVAWHHDWHGEVEHAIYREIEERRDEATLVALLNHARSVCTVGGCAPALARLKSEVAFPLILERLPSDTNMFAMKLPEALAIYQRPEAVPALGRALEDAMTRMADERDPMELMTSIGTRRFIDRCIWAVASFPGPEAAAILRKAAKAKRADLEVEAAMFRQGRNPKAFAALMARLAKDPRQAEYIAGLFEEAGLPEASQVAALIPPKPKGKARK